VHPDARLRHVGRQYHDEQRRPPRRPQREADGPAARGVMGAERTALVLAGGGARGAYEAGALSLLLPELERRGQRPSVYAGTSVGAINAVLLAAQAHLPADEAVGRLVELWEQLDKSQVIRPILRRQGPLAALRYAGELMSIPGVRLPSVLDPTPLHTTLDHWVDWEALHRNVSEGA